MMRTKIRVLIPVGVGLLLAIPGARAEAHRGVVWIPSSTLRTQIHKAPAKAQGSTWIDYVQVANGAVLMVRRDKPGRAEVHTRMTDVWYVIEGHATLVTGGLLVTPRSTEIGELRGESISGGAQHLIGPGDLIDIPAGTPHWVSAIKGGKLVYLTVKIQER